MFRCGRAVVAVGVSANNAGCDNAGCRWCGEGGRNCDVRGCRCCVCCARAVVRAVLRVAEQVIYDPQLEPLPAARRISWAPTQTRGGEAQRAWQACQRVPEVLTAAVSVAGAVEVVVTAAASAPPMPPTLDATTAMRHTVGLAARAAAAHATAPTASTSVGGGDGAGAGDSTFSSAIAARRKYHY